MIGLLCVLFVFQLGTLFLIEGEDVPRNCTNAVVFGVLGTAINAVSILYILWSTWYFGGGVC